MINFLPKKHILRNEMSGTIMFSLLIEYLIGRKKVYVLMRRFIIQTKIWLVGSKARNVVVILEKVSGQE